MEVKTVKPVEGKNQNPLNLPGHYRKEKETLQVYITEEVLA
jgi:hypothetical protein